MNSSSKKHRKSKFLLSYYENISISHIAREFRTNRPKVERVIKKAIAYGIYDSLRDIPRKGRKRTISSEARAWIISVACMKSKDVGHPHEIWTLRLLAQQSEINVESQDFLTCRRSPQEQYQRS